MSTLVARRPPANDGAREALYAGTIFRWSANDASRALIERVRALVEREFETRDPRSRAFELGTHGVFDRVGAVRRALFDDHDVEQALARLVAAEGFALDEVAVDPPRLRCILPRGEDDPRAHAIYVTHRDTWYGHPRGLITWWLPLDDLEADETFVFYPDALSRPVANGSADFDYTAWTACGQALRIGWQDRDAGLREHYPGAPAALDLGEELGFSCEAAGSIVFAGAHLHRTPPLSREARRGRFSVDFRLVHLGDHAAGRGAPDVDDRSTGSALPDYRRLRLEERTRD